MIRCAHPSLYSLFAVIGCDHCCDWMMITRYPFRSRRPVRVCSKLSARSSLPGVTSVRFVQSPLVSVCVCLLLAGVGQNFSAQNLMFVVFLRKRFTRKMISIVLSRTSWLTSNGEGIVSHLPQPHSSPLQIPPG